MTKKVSWGVQLEPDEIMVRDMKRLEAWVKLDADVFTLLDGHGYNIKVNYNCPVCLDCPRESRDCHVCRMDAAMSGHLTKPALVITLYPDGER